MFAAFILTRSGDSEPGLAIAVMLFGGLSYAFGFALMVSTRLILDGDPEIVSSAFVASGSAFGSTLGVALKRGSGPSKNPDDYR